MGAVTIVGSYVVALVVDTDRLPVAEETVIGWNYHETHGGKGSNMAVAAARLGADARFLGKIGRDRYGEAFLELLREEGVREEHVLYAETTPTATGFIISCTDGRNIIVTDRGANGDFSPEDIALHSDAITQADVIVSPLEIPLDTALAAARVAHAHGVSAILNPAPAEDLRSHDVQCVFALTPNEGEARVCLGLPPDDPTPDEDIAVRLYELGVEHVLLTRGEKGVLWVSSEGVRTVPALRVNVLDTVGAGDAFNAGLAVGLSEKRPMTEAIALGVTTASLSTELRETILSYPHRDKVSRRCADVLSSIA